MLDDSVSATLGAACHQPLIVRVLRCDRPLIMRRSFFVVSPGHGKVGILWSCGIELSLLQRPCTRARLLSAISVRTDLVAHIDTVLQIIT